MKIGWFLVELFDVFVLVEALHHVGGLCMEKVDWQLAALRKLILH
jgi:hypothetical protein